jgi:hypothetical protein
MYYVSQQQCCFVVLLCAAAGEVCFGTWRERLVYLVGRKPDWTSLRMHLAHDLKCLVLPRLRPLQPVLAV